VCCRLSGSYTTDEISLSHTIHDSGHHYDSAQRCIQVAAAVARVDVAMFFLLQLARLPNSRRLLLMSWGRVIDLAPRN
jgi:hypothetical protein